MINPDALVKDLKQQVLALEADLRERIELPEFNEPWTEEHRAARAGDRTAQTFTEWADDRITQAAVSWVLTTVFIRFCEDNRLLSPVWISGPPERRQEALDAQLAYFRTNPEDTDREWVRQGIEHLAATPATKGLVDEQAMLHTVSPSGQAVTKLLDFWRTHDDAGNLVHDFTDPDLGTRFLGDLYQDLSDHAKRTYALLQTPEFVEEFILDRTLEPALKDRPLDGFKLIDPACGSGHFLLGAFRRFLDRWEKEAPGMALRERIQKSLSAVWGVDINPFAVAIAHFRLTVAALREFESASLENAPGFTYNVLTGDSLWFSHDQGSLVAAEHDFSYSTEEKYRLIATLERDQYDVVVTNPPYITVKDRALNAAYRERFSHLKGKYQQTAPFMELAFALGKRGSVSKPAGWIGQITSNAFMKREFGVPVIEDLLANLDVREVIDTSGAYIPGHGTPTLIIIGRNQSPQGDRVRAVLGIRGEPGTPVNAGDGIVWTTIKECIDRVGSQNSYISVEDVNREYLQSHPWSLSGGSAPKALARLEGAAHTELGVVSESIGITSFTLADDAFLAPQSAMRTRRVREEFVRWMVLGDQIRDWTVSPETAAIFPYTSDFKPLTDGLSSSLDRWLWPCRTTLTNNQMFGGQTKVQAGLHWSEYGRLTASKLRIPLSITFAEVASGNHFVLDRGGKVFKQTAPVIKLPEGASEDEHLRLLGVLNSSTACFWLKQKCHNKGNGGIGGGIGDEAWEPRYQFNGTTLQDFPLPKVFPLDRARILDALSQELGRHLLAPLFESSAPTAGLVHESEAAQSSLRGLMIAQQEELDWEVYPSYGLMDDALTYAGEPPEVRLGERAFEIVLARRIAAGEEETSWFERHGSTPITEIPAHWPTDYRELVQRRIDAIESVDAIRLLETPEFKRRWATEPFEKQKDRALRGWLLDRLEARELWFTPQGQVRPQTIGQLADVLGRDAAFVDVVDLWTGRRDSDLVAALTSLMEAEAVPYLAAHRLKDPGLRKFAEWQRTWDLQRREDAGEPVGDIPVPPKYTSTDFRKPSYWSARGKLDVPKERFILYPGAGRETDHTLLLGWAGWDHAQQSLALALIIQQRQAEGASDEVLVPLVAGLAEVQPWVEQWHSKLDPEFGLSPAQFSADQLRTHMLALGVTHDDLAAWRPPAATRGRKARS